MRKAAVITGCGCYRNALWRKWDGALPCALFIGLNPSTADTDQDNTTLRRCIGFAQRWGNGGVIMANLFALRVTKPAALRGYPRHPLYVPCSADPFPFRLSE